MGNSVRIVRMVWSTARRYAAFVGISGLLSCAASGPTREIAAENGFDRLVRELGLKFYSANLHSHHFMGRGKPETYPCQIGAEPPFDDGRPCRNNDAGVNEKIEHAEFLDYFSEACRYAKERGGLDILFVTPHTKSGRENTTDVGAQDFADRQKLLKTLNKDFGGSFYCGLGQEAGSVSTGNHLGIVGHIRSEAPRPTEPLYFPTGRYDLAYREIADRSRRGEKFILQFNHPDVNQDLWWEELSAHVGGGKEALLNDYGLDDFAPMGCFLNRAHVTGVPGACAEPTGKSIDRNMLTRSYSAMREASGDPFRLIEVGRTGGATTNSGVAFKTVRKRNGKVGHGSLDPEIRDYIHYLNMGFRLAPTANQDNHHMNWGSATSARTGVLARSLAEEDVIGALDERRTFASEDQNARALIYARLPEGKAVMGDIVETRASSVRLTVAYDDPDAADAMAALRVFYYRAGENLGEGKEMLFPTIQRLIEFRARPVLPSGAPSQVYDRPIGPLDPSIRAGQPRVFDIPLLEGEQYLFAQLTQRDQDRVWTAPIWIRRTLR